MYNVIVAEDDIPINNWVSHIIDKNCDGFTVVYRANNGEQALKAFTNQTLPIEVIISDIVMPVMTGIEFIRNIKKTKKDTVVILLTCHSDFSYAREGIELGINHYFLKDEVTQEDIINTMAKIKQELDERKEEQKKTKNRPLLNQLVETLIRDEHLSQQEKDVFNTMLPIDTNKSYFCSCVFFDDVQLIGDIASCFKDKAYRDFYNVQEIFQGSKSMFVMANFKETIDVRTQELALHNLCKLIHEKFNISVGIGKIYRESDRAIDSILEALSILRQCWFYNSPILLSYANLYTPTTEQRELLSLSVNRFKAPCSNEVIRQNVELLFSCIHDNKIYEKRYVQSTLSKVITLLQQNILGFDSTTTEIIKNIEECKNIYFAKKAICDFVDHLPENLIPNGTCLSPVIENAIKYINRNFNSPQLSLQNSAEHISLNPSYFSALFKKETGLKYQEYLMSVRMEHAHKIITGGSVKINTVAINVGYENATSFSRAFSKYFGYSPTDLQHR